MHLITLKKPFKSQQVVGCIMEKARLGQTALIVVHRFHTAIQADVIHVMDEDCTIETSTRAEWVALSGRYARSWRKQMRADPKGAGNV